MEIFSLFPVLKILPFVDSVIPSAREFTSTCLNTACCLLPLLRENAFGSLVIGGQPAGTNSGKVSNRDGPLSLLPPPSSPSYFSSTKSTFISALKGRGTLSGNIPSRICILTMVSFPPFSNNSSVRILIIRIGSNDDDDEPSLSGAD
ncbi:wsv219 [White spot syndrome virus]|uniref:Wsv219 n=4 Tax=White spot syndrome virus TaxID=342409 RepID=Q8VAZ6_WSSVS|nr:wsv219 [Shrimp white spot syndrome virus]AFX59596.1 wsv219 [White spot syndrome virus]AAL33223.1 wsv219 [Shrimp white spot syndrome virus]AAL89142.1 WSSV274 [Shrimp white spot syndrome virus]AWQ60390.1 wsv219 [Shrimp white spot syndrome virus]AWQ60805.1 wsv219 [Shrimp white spot syndrome virus]